MTLLGGMKGFIYEVGFVVGTGCGVCGRGRGRRDGCGSRREVKKVVKLTRVLLGEEVWSALRSEKKSDRLLAVVSFRKEGTRREDVLEGIIDSGVLHDPMEQVRVAAYVALGRVAGEVGMESGWFERFVFILAQFLGEKGKGKEEVWVVERILLSFLVAFAVVGACRCRGSSDSVGWIDRR